MSASSTPQPQTDLKAVVESEIKEWHFHIYFHQNNAAEQHEALKLRDAVLRLRRDGAFVAVPLFRVNTGPMGPHPVGSYEIWAPSETFASVFSYLCINRGSLSILVHPLTKEVRATTKFIRKWLRSDLLTYRDHEIRNAWIGPSFPLDLSTLTLRSDEIPLQYPSLKLGYSAKETLTIPMRLKLGENVEYLLEGEQEAARAPPRDCDEGAL